MNLASRIVFIILIQTLVLFSIIGIRQWTLNTGTKINLETTPVDPRSLFSGDYVQLAYKINEVSAPKAFLEGIKPNDTVYVTLAPKGRYWVAESIQTTKPEIVSPNIMIKGRVDYKDASKDPGKVFVKYGIENYFIPEGEGKKLERPKPGETITVKVSVDRMGSAAIAGVYVNDRALYQETLF